jgi:hypothetical protein
VSSAAANRAATQVANRDILAKALAGEIDGLKQGILYRSGKLEQRITLVQQDGQNVLRVRETYDRKVSGEVTIALDGSQQFKAKAKGDNVSAQAVKELTNDAARMLRAYVENGVGRVGFWSKISELRPKATAKVIKLDSFRNAQLPKARPASAPAAKAAFG